jgi:PPOX class probable FMN-dependent enzyme
MTGPDPHAASRIADEAALRTVIGEPMDFVKAKLGAKLNPAMQDFVGKAPLLLVGTYDAENRIDISPKGDPGGFVEIESPTVLLIPERPGNRLTFGFLNILTNGKIGLLFMVPNQRETLRIKGTATLHTDPAVLARMQVQGKPALLYTRVEISECFFHCGKALIRSHLWQPDKWNAETRSIAARHMAGDVAPDAAGVERTEAALEHSYGTTLY